MSSPELPQSGTEPAATFSVLHEPAEPMSARPLTRLGQWAGRRLTSSLLGLSLAAGIAPAPNETVPPLPAAMSESSSYQPNADIWPLPDPWHESCAPTSEKALRTAKLLIQHPDTSVFEKPADDILWHPLFSMQDKYHESSDKQLFGTYQKAAEKHGLTFRDPMPYLDRFREDIWKNQFDEYGNPQPPTMPSSEYWDAAREYVGSFGITLRAAEAGSEFPTLTAQDFESPQVKRGLYAIIQEMARYPQELFDMMGDRFKAIIVYLDESGKGKGQYAGQAFFDRSAISLNLIYQGNPRTALPHELAGHMVDVAVCGGPWSINNDPLYSMFNIGGEYDESIAKEPYVYDELFKKLGGLTSEIYTYRQAQDYGTACRMADRIVSMMYAKGEHITLVSGYADTPTEDKAEFMDKFAHPVGGLTLFDPVTPRVQAKATQLVARLVQYGGEPMGAYFTDTLYRPGTAHPYVSVQENCAAPLEMGAGTPGK